jgi:hypothetical protein
LHSLFERILPEVVLRIVGRDKRKTRWRQMEIQWLMVENGAQSLRRACWTLGKL